ncbi:hypothetical protein [Methylibium sp.]|uniref:hypothetical protein n=1 Tax=Methylibium sp. TaxID=2067992 RepID=UPI003D10BFE8
MPTDAAFKVRHDQAMASSSLEPMLHYYRINWPAEPYRQRAEPPPPVKALALLIRGLADPYALPAGLNDAWQWVDHELTILTLPRAGHFIQHDCAAQLVRTLQHWLSRNPVRHPSDPSFSDLPENFHDTSKGTS